MFEVTPFYGTIKSRKMGGKVVEGNMGLISALYSNLTVVMLE